MELAGVGYKQSDVGVIPEDWEATKLQSAATNITVGFVGSMAHLFVREGVRLLRGQNILPQKLDLTNLKFVSRETHRLWKKSALLAGDIAIVRVGYPGTACSIPEGLGDLNAASLVLVRPDRTKLDSAYLTYVLNSPWGREQVGSLLVGGAQQVFNTGTAANFVVPLPRTSEQRAIAGALSDVDALIDSLDHLIAKKQNLKQAAMQQLLTGKTRLPGFQPTGHIDVGGMGVLPGDWGVVAFNDVCLKIQDGTHFSPTLGGSDYLYVTSRNIHFGALDVSNADTISEQEHRKIYSRCDTRRGDLLLTKDGANTGNAALNTLAEECSLLSSVAFLRFDSRRDDAGFFLQYILSGPGQRRLKEMMSGNAITRLTLAKIRRFLVPRPSLDEQSAISAVLSDMDAELAALEERRDKTVALKQGMMQQLLTGRTRLV